MDNQKRVIVDFKKLTPKVLKLLVERYPDDYEEFNDDDPAAIPNFIIEEED